MKFFIIHGAYGNSKENWFPWLKEQLEAQGHEVIAPDFPTPAGQSLESWMKVFKPYLKKVDEETVFVGHSVGAGFTLSILEKLGTKAKACFFVAGFLGALNNAEVDEINKTIVGKSFDWAKIKQNCAKFICYQSTNDPYVPMQKGKELAEKLGAELIVIPNAGHFNAKAGYTKFEQLLGKIKEEN